MSNQSSGAAVRNSVLVVGQSEEVIAQVVGALDGLDYHFITSKNVPEALSSITYKIPDIIISEVDLPSINGFELLRKIRLGIKTRLIPFIFLSLSGDAFARIEAYQSGADAYLLLPFIADELRALVLSRIKQINDFYQIAVTDELTRLFNRREFLKRFNQEISNPANSVVSLALLDIDHFKKVNDMYGHQMGDSVLMNLADVLKHNPTGSMFPARFGGEEFVLLFPGTGVNEAKNEVDTLREKFREMEFKSGKGEIFHVSFSAGIAEYPTMASNLSHLLSQADHALYAAKIEGRNRSVVFSPVMARNDKFWDYLKSRKEVFVDSNGCDRVTKICYLPSVLETIVNLDFEIKSIGIMCIKTSRLLDIEQYRGVRNLHYDMENITKVILISCEHHFPSDTYIALSDLFGVEFIVLFPSIVDFSYNVDKFNDLCDDIATDMAKQLRCSCYDIEFSSNVVYYDKDNPWELVRDISMVRERRKVFESMRARFDEGTRAFLRGESDFFEPGFYYNINSTTKAYCFIKSPQAWCQSLFFDILSREHVRCTESLSGFKFLMGALFHDIEVPVLVPWVPALPLGEFSCAIADAFQGKEIVIMINESVLKDALPEILKAAESVPVNISWGIDNCYVGNDILNYVSVLDLKVISFSENSIRNIHRFTDRIRVFHGLKIFSDQVGIQVLATNVIHEEEFQVLKDIKFDFMAGPYIEDCLRQEEDGDRC